MVTWALILRKWFVRVWAALLLLQLVRCSRPVITLMQVLWTGAQRLLWQQVLLGRLTLDRLRRMMPALGPPGLLNMVTLKMLGFTLTGPRVLTAWASVVPLVVRLTVLRVGSTGAVLVVLTVLALTNEWHSVRDPVVG